MADIRFVEETHKYYLGDKELISVTTLMQKHGLAPSYEGVDPNVLKAKAERGTLIHKEIEDYCVRDEIGFTEELSRFIEYVENNDIKVLGNEVLVHNDIVAGTADLILGNNTIADIKTTYTVHTDAVSWQLSIYAYLYNQTLENKENMIVNGKVFHFNNQGELDVKDIPLKPEWMVEKLLKCEEDGITFTYDLDFADNKLARIVEVENYIKEVKLAQKKAELEADLLKTELMLAMEKQGIKSFQNDSFKITYVDEYERSTFDSKKFKVEHPDLYKDYIKVNTVEPTVKITIRN